MSGTGCVPMLKCSEMVTGRGGVGGEGLGGGGWGGGVEQWRDHP